MLVDDALLPAAAHLTGPDAVDVLAPVVVAAGGRLVRCEPTAVQYRPRRELVVRYRCVVRNGASTAADTLLAATTTSGPLPGTVPVEAVTPDGTELRVGVWRWPFDPILPDLATMTTPHLAAPLLRSLVGGRPGLEVVAYRPTERAVIRASGPERDVYVKVVPPATAPSLVDRHARLVRAGIPAPRVLAVDGGWIALEALPGTTLRDRLKGGPRALPSPVSYRDLLRSVGVVDVGDLPPVRSRLLDAPHHAAMLARVLPGSAARVSEIIERVGAPIDAQRDVATVHGDLHEAQLVVDDHTVTGLLDVDDLGPGDPLADIGTLVAHLRFRAMTCDDPRVDAYADEVREAVAIGRDPAAVDRHVAAVLVGLATGPFRIQQRDWEMTTRRVLDLAERHLRAATAAMT